MLDERTLFAFNYGVYVVSSEYQGRKSACLVNTLSQVTAEPIKVTVALHKDNFTTDIIAKAGRFCGVVLSQDADLSYLGRFGFQSSRDTDKFAGISYGLDSHFIPYPLDYSAGRISCEVVDQLDMGTHILFVGKVVEAVPVPHADPLTYTDYHRIKGGKTPKRASSYLSNERLCELEALDAQVFADGASSEDEKSSFFAEVPAVVAVPMQEGFERQERATKDIAQDVAKGDLRIGWRCLVCGYIEWTDELNPDYLCPICGVGIDMFERV